MAESKPPHVSNQSKDSWGIPPDDEEYRKTIEKYERKKRRNEGIILGKKLFGKGSALAKLSDRLPKGTPATEEPPTKPSFRRNTDGAPATQVPLPANPRDEVLLGHVEPLPSIIKESLKEHNELLHIHYNPRSEIPAPQAISLEKKSIESYQKAQQIKDFYHAIEDKIASMDAIRERKLPVGHEIYDYKMLVRDMLHVFLNEGKHGDTHRLDTSSFLLAMHDMNKRIKPSIVKEVMNRFGDFIKTGRWIDPELGVEMPKDKIAQTLQSAKDRLK